MQLYTDSSVLTKYQKTNLFVFCYNFIILNVNIKV